MAVAEMSTPMQRFFPEMSRNEVEEEYPIFPLNYPGMPPPGPDFVAQAMLLGDELPDPGWKVTELREFIKNQLDDEVDPPVINKMKKAELYSLALSNSLNDSWLESMYRAAIYKPKFNLTITASGRVVNAEFLPGSLWNAYAPPGPSPAEVMIVGKHPGVEELRVGHHFAGDTSQELLRAIDTLGIAEDDASQWYATNVIKHLNYTTKGDTIPADWLKNCMMILYQELLLVKPKFILCLGSDAAKAILGRGTKITSTIGRIYDLQIPANTLDNPDEIEYYTAKVVCCTHPAKVSREPELFDKPEFLGSIKLFADLAFGVREGIQEEDLERNYVYTADQQTALRDKIMSETDEEYPVIALDMEWHGDYPWDAAAYPRTIQLSHKPKYGCSIVLHHQGGKQNQEICQNILRDDLIEILKHTETRKPRLVGHNLKSDLPWLEHYLDIDLSQEFYGPKDAIHADGIERLFGWQKTKYEGGFDTMIAAHAVSETGPFKLEVLAAHYLGCPRYDAELQDWRAKYCKEHKIKEKALEGYGDCPDEILLPYGAYDADVTRRIFDVYNGVDAEPGLLDRDKFGNCCREEFWTNQMAALAFMEIEQTGMWVDEKRAQELTVLYATVQASLLSELRGKIGWEEFNPESSYHRCELLFGEQLNGKRTKEGNPIRIRPDDAISLGLTPVTTTDSRIWEQALNNRKQGEFLSASSDKETLAILANQAPEVKMLGNLRTIGQVLKTVLKPKTVAENEEDGVYEKGLMSFRSALDGRVRTHFFLVETGRVSSSNPNLQNITQKMEAQYKKILGADYKYPIRSIFGAKPGNVIIEADFVGAELSIMAWLSGDPVMMEHVRRANLPDGHPDKYDILSNIAVDSFNLKCSRDKKGLKDAGVEHLRTAAKNRMYGMAYGQGPDGAMRKCQEEGVEVTLEQIERVTNGIFGKYVRLKPYLDSCKARVTNPGYMMNPFGAYRRFMRTDNNKLRADMEREALNWPMQSVVARMMSRALDNIYYWKYEYPDCAYWQIVLQLHDAVYIECPVELAEHVYTEMLPMCMTKRVPMYPCDFDGNPRGDGPYHLGIDRKVCLRWGEPVTKEQAIEIGLPLQLISK